MKDKESGFDILVKPKERGCGMVGIPKALGLDDNQVHRDGRDS